MARHHAYRLLKLSGLAVALGLAVGEPAVRAEDLVAINELAFYPEQPLWHNDALFYAEMSKDRVVKWDGKRNTPFWTSRGCGPTSVAEGQAQTLIILCHLQNALAKIDMSGHTVRFIDRDADGASFMDPNGSANDKKGGLYFSSSGIFAYEAPAQGSVYYLDSNEVLRKVADKIWYSNGVALSHDGRKLFVSEHLGRRVLVYSINPDATLGDRAVFLNLNDIVSRPAPGAWWVGPDGLLMDRNDNLYIAEYGGGRLIIVDRDGHLQKTIHVPEQYITAARFGSTEERLFITAPGNNTIPPFEGKVYSVRNPLWK
jgi:gluconolactonase